MNPIFKQIQAPFVAGIIEKDTKSGKSLLMQTRWKPGKSPNYTGTLEFAAGLLDNPYENIFDALAREIKEETGLILIEIIDKDQTKMYSPQDDDLAFGFRPFCCTQQLKGGLPWIGFIFRCRVEDSTPKAQESEVKNVRWMKAEVVKDLFINSPEKLFTLEIPVWEYYFKDEL